jgi:hypothetical protein
MRLAAVVVLLFLWSCAKKDVSPAVQLFANTDMETGTTGPVNWWHQGNGTSAVFLWTATTGSSGTHSLEISSSASLSQVVYWGQSITTKIPVGKDLTLKVLIKGKITGPGAAVAVSCLNASSTTQAEQFSTTQGTSVIQNNADWMPYTVKLSGVHSDIIEIRTYLMMLPGSTGSVYFDDVTLTAQ